MRALVTGASSGMGRDMARILSAMGYDLILTARRRERLESLAAELPGKTEVLCFDLSKKEDCYALYQVAGEIDVLINNAGFGIFGDFLETDLEQELNMTAVNCCAMHILTKLYVRDFVRRGSGYILNVASAAGFMPGGPLLDGYYASKAYTLNLTRSVAKGLKRRRSSVRVAALCPGPVKTEFEEVAGVDFTPIGKKSDDVARYAIKKLFHGKTVIVPGLAFKLGRFLTRFLPDCALLSLAYVIQAPRQRSEKRGEHYDK